MSFEVETPKNSAVHYVYDWLQDQMDPQATDTQRVRCMAHHLIGHMSPDRGDPRRPKTLATIRKHFLAVWPFLERLGVEQPDLFDEVMVAYVERYLSGD